MSCHLESNIFCLDFHSLGVEYSISSASNFISLEYHNLLGVTPSVGSAGNPLSNAAFKTSSN